MDAKYLAEIKAQANRLVELADNPFCQGPVSLLNGIKQVVPALLAEVERLIDQHQCDVHNLAAMQTTLDQQAKNCENLLAAKDQQITTLIKQGKTWKAVAIAQKGENATLKKALEVASAEVNKAFEILESRHVIIMTQKASGIQENINTWIQWAKEQKST